MTIKSRAKENPVRERDFYQIPDELCETRPTGFLSKEDHDVRALVVIVLIT